MDIISIVFIALGLAMDAFAVSISSGVVINFLKLNDAFKIAFFFGMFQAIMPIIGWLAGLSFRKFISGFDHWIAFGLIIIVGCRMIYESNKKGVQNKLIDPLNIYVLLVLSLATSIDALAVGISLTFLKTSIILPAIIIGITTFLLSGAGVYMGNKLGHYLEKKFEVMGGIILIVIAFRILIAHLS